MEILVVIGLILWAVLGAGDKKKKQSAPKKKADLGDRMREIGSLIREEFEEEAAPVREGVSPARAQARPQEALRTDMKMPEPKPFRPEPEKKPFRYTDADFLTRAPEHADLAAEEEQAPALEISFDRNAVLQGVIYSEILGNRPSARRKTWNPYAR